MSKLRISSYVIFHMLEEAETVFVQDSEELELFAEGVYTNNYERLRAILAHIDSIDEQPTVYADFDGHRQAFLIGRDDLEHDEEIVNHVVTPWAEKIMAEYEKENIGASLNEFMQFMMQDDCKEDLWNCWNYGEFSSIYHEWPDCPAEAFYFSDTELFAAC